ncbi:hypothetical protein D3C75_981950 [compost metagenome]
MLLQRTVTVGALIQAFNVLLEPEELQLEAVDTLGELGVYLAHLLQGRTVAFGALLQRIEPALELLLITFGEAVEGHAIVLLERPVESS